jgi:hypothetical protein
MRMDFLDEKTIRLDKVITELDRFLFSFLKVLKKHTDYVVVSGYVSILFGRARATEDIDITIRRMEEEEFRELLSDLLEKEFWCLNSEDKDICLSLLKDGHAVRFAEKDIVIPNIELKFEKTGIDSLNLRENIEVMMGEERIKISPIELQIIYKEDVLKSEKDMEDALHLREVFKDYIKKEKLEYYKKLVSEGYGKA